MSRPKVTWETTTRRHGTHSGWSFHQALGEIPCDPCYRAKAEYDKRRKAAPEETRVSRLRATAQGMAHTVLRVRHHDEYRAAYEAACADLGVPCRPPKVKS